MPHGRTEWDHLRKRDSLDGFIFRFEYFKFLEKYFFRFEPFWTMY